MKKEQTRNIEQLVDEQIAKWNRLRAKPCGEKTKTCEVIAISRESGTGGTTIAENLANSMNMDLMDGDIIKKVAESVQMSESVVASLDEKRIVLIEDWLKILFSTNHLWPDKYLKHLTKIISAMGSHGNAVIVGRGANYILPPQETFRVRLIAPFNVRVANAGNKRGLSRDEAERYVIQTDSDRKAFILKYFHADISDPANYDLVIDTNRLGIEGAGETIKCAFNVWKKHKPLQDIG
jgi:cytidylate kinase